MRRELMTKTAIIVISMAAMAMFSGCDNTDSETATTVAATTQVVTTAQVTEKATEKATEKETEKQTTKPAQTEKEVDYDLYNSVITKVSDAEEKASNIEFEMSDNENATQKDLNDYAKQIYDIWDGQLNYVWGILEDNLDKDTMSKLRDEERKWIDKKEADAKAEADGNGSMSDMIYYQAAAQATKERVYELTEYLQ